MKRISLLLVVLIYAGNIWAAVSQPPAPSRSKQAQAPNAQSAKNLECSAPNQRGSDEAPFVIKVLPAPNANPPAAYQSCQQNNEPSSDMGLTIATVVIAVFTGGVFFFTGFMWWTTRDTAKRQLRAYMGVSEEMHVPGGKIGGHGPVTFKPFMKNYGSTPAYDVWVESNTGIFKKSEIGPSFHYRTKRTPNPSKGTMSPGQSNYIDCKSEEDISDQDIKGINFSDNALFVYGTVHYHDAFTKPRKTNFCFEIKFRGDSREIDGWHITTDHNDAD